MTAPADNLCSSASCKRALIAGSVGNFIEWYELAVYGFLATVIEQTFFRLEGESVLNGLLLTCASFAIADAKQHHGHRYARYRGLMKVQMQCLLAATAQNMKKMAFIIF